MVHEYPSEFFRTATERILARVEDLGPTRPPEDEYRRVYRFLHFNEPSRIERILSELETRKRRSGSPLDIRVDAWAYVASTFDEWINHARIFYVITGLVEGTLRSRIDAHLTARFGQNWPTNPDAAPESVRDNAKQLQRDNQLREIRELVINAEKIDEPRAALMRIANILTPIPARDSAQEFGPTFVTSLDLGRIQALLGSRKHWGGKAQLQEIFQDPSTGKPPRRDELHSLFEKLRSVRNDVAHYRPGEELSFAQPLLAASRLARWLELDLQHTYSSVDSRHTTELSRLLGPLLDDLVRNLKSTAKTCEAADCPIGEPVDWLLNSIPEASSADAPTLTRACLYHRVKIREQKHRPMLVQG
jgi:hypothetical protein